MTESFSTLRVNADRMLDSFIHLALIGATGDGGVSRVTFSEAHLAARKWFRDRDRKLWFGISHGWRGKSFCFADMCR